MAHTADRSSSSLIEYFSSQEFKNRDAYAMVTQPSGVFFSSAAPILSRLASKKLRAYSIAAGVTNNTCFSVAYEVSIFSNIFNGGYYVTKAFSFCSFHTKKKLLVVDCRGRKWVIHEPD